MIAPKPVYKNDPPSLLADVREAVSLRPALADYPQRLGAEHEADEEAVRACLEALLVDGLLCP
jgi:hypothetical protein